MKGSVVLCGVILVGFFCSVSGIYWPLDPPSKKNAMPNIFPEGKESIRRDVVCEAHQKCVDDCGVGPQCADRCKMLKCQEGEKSSGDVMSEMIFANGQENMNPAHMFRERLRDAGIAGHH